MSGAAQRLDKWLWCARFLRRREDAAALCEKGRIRIAGRVVAKASAMVRAGDVLTFPLGPHIRTVKVLGFAERRGGAELARTLYEDLYPPEPSPP